MKVVALIFSVVLVIPAGAFRLKHPASCDVSKRHMWYKKHTFLMQASKDSQKEAAKTTTKNLGSYYRRPSAALERGGGFFVPGLEGYRLRLVMGGLAISLIGLNRWPGYVVDASQIRSETIGLLCAFLSLLQAIVDMQTEMAVSRRREAISSEATSETLGAAPSGENTFGEDSDSGSDLKVSSVSPNLGVEGNRLKWIGGVILQLTPACTVLFISNQKEVVGRFGLADRGAANNVSEVPAPSVVLAGDAVMNVLPSVCQQALVIGIRGGGALVMGTTLRGAGVWGEADKAWLERLGAYVRNL